MKYKLINKNTKEEHLCDKVTLDGFEYYVSDKLPQLADYAYNSVFGIGQIIKEYDINCFYSVHKSGGSVTTPWERNIKNDCKKIIATNNSNIDISQVVDEVEMLGNVFSNGFQLTLPLVQVKCLNEGFKTGYNKSQETHSNSDEDMIEFKDWCMKIALGSGLENKSTKELLQLWKEQQLKVLFYQ